MNRSVPTGIWVATALPFEARSLAKALGRAAGSLRETLGRGWSVSGRFAGRPVRLLVTGPGPERARLAARALAPRGERPALLLCAGVAGALRAELAVGEILLADAVCEVSGARRATDRAWRDRARRVLERNALAWQRGLCLGVDRVLKDPRAKAEAAQGSGADVVQMEDHVWAAWASRQGVAFLSVRAVLDALSHPIPLPALGFSWRGPRPAEVAAALLRHPRATPALLRLGRAQRRSERALATFLAAFLADAASRASEVAQTELPSAP